MRHAWTRASLILGMTLALGAAGAAGARAQDAPASPAPSPTPGFTYSGFVRSYDFTRQNASGYPGTNDGKQVNQASWSNAIDLHADYNFTDSFYVGGTYFGSEPFDGPCSIAANHVKSGPNASYGCVEQTSPNTDPDDTLPGFALSTFTEAYLGYRQGGISAKAGDQLFNSPWAGSYDGTRLKPAAYQGADVAYAMAGGWTFEAADMIQFENRTANTFSNSTLLTSYPIGNPGLPSNIYAPGGTGINTAGFFYGKLGYAPTDRYALEGYFYSMSDILNMWWFDGKYALGPLPWKPFVAMQGGVESNAGASVLGKIDSSMLGVQLGATPYAGKLGSTLVTAGFDEIPWQTDNVVLPTGWACSNVNDQLGPTTLVNGKKTVTSTLAYFLPTNAGQCHANANGTTEVYYGGWASPYTDGYATDPMFTTSLTQGVPDRRSPGTSFKVAGTYTTLNKRWVFLASMAWYNYGNAVVAETTNEWDLDGQYHFSRVGKGPYKGLLLRYRYGQRELSNAFLASGAEYLGGLPLFKYNRAQLEYDF